jgi:GNAT superfamily N-acetyltransferase
MKNCWKAFGSWVEPAMAKRNRHGENEWGMKLSFELAAKEDAAELAAIHKAAADELTRQFGQGAWSGAPSERGILATMRLPEFSRILVARSLVPRTKGKIIGALRLATKKPWAIDVSYFTAVSRPLYLTGMVVDPRHQGKGVGRALVVESAALAREWPADAIRLDAWDAEAGAGGFYAKCGYRKVAHAKYKGAPLVYFEMLIPRAGEAT